MSCPHFGSCGGCAYQDLSYEAQLTKKDAEVRELLAEVIRSSDARFENPAQSPRIEGYRNKMEYTFGNERKDGPLTVGLHRKKSFHDIIPVTGCTIVDEDYRRILSGTMEYFDAGNTPFFNRKRHTGYLRHLLVRKAAKTGELLIDLVTTWNGNRPEELTASGRDFPLNVPVVEEEEKLLSGFVSMLRELPLDGTLRGVLHTRNDSIADVVRDEDTRVLLGEDHFHEELLGLSFRITPFSFFQTNSLGAEVLYSVVRDYVKEAGGVAGKTVYDLYSGTGTIAQILAPVAENVVGVEIVSEAVGAARENAAENGLTNCEFLCGDVFAVLDQIEEKPDLIVLDPPRDGVQPKALSKIISYQVPSIVYVSCKPKSLARDLIPLQAAGYEVKRLRCVDMFPFTGNMECVCLLRRVGNTRHATITLDVDMEDYYRMKGDRAND